MPMVRCPADEHYYDPELYDECPYCRKTHYVTQQPAQPTGSKADRQTQRVNPETAKTRVIFGDKGESFEGVEPVVGWLVVLNGKARGSDRRIIPGMNRIGRDRDMAITLDIGDDTISRKEHGFIVYDPLNHQFFIQHGSGQNLTYLNGAVVMGAQPLNDRDRIRVGNTELLFIALCDKTFNWA